MRDRWTLRGLFGTVEVELHPGGVAGESRAESIRELKVLLFASRSGEPRARGALVEIFERVRGQSARPAFGRAFGSGPSPVRIDELERSLEAAASAGQILVRRRDVRRVAVPEEAKDEEQVLGPEPDKESVDFVVQYPNGKAVSDLAYVLTDPTGKDAKGKLPSDGTVSRHNVDSGTWTLTLKEIDEVAWSPAKVRAGEQATLAVRASGYDEGASFKVNFYRQYREQPKDALGKAQGKLANGRAEVTWTYDPTTTDARKKETRVVSVVAEVVMDDDSQWRKSKAPLQVVHARIAELAWGDDVATPGDSPSLTIQAEGFADGTEAKVALWRADMPKGDAKAKDLPGAKLAGGAATVTFDYGEGKDVEAPGEYYAVVTIEADGITRTRASALLWCAEAGAVDESAGGDADPAAPSAQDAQDDDDDDPDQPRAVA